MKEESRKIDIRNVLHDGEEKEVFVHQMTRRFDIIKKLMDYLCVEIHNKDKLVEAKTLFCACTLIKYLDEFVEEMQEFINETESLAH